MAFKEDENKSGLVPWVALAASMVALVVTFVGRRSPENLSPTPTSSVSTDAFSLVQKNRVLRVGYGGFPPYVIEDASSPNDTSKLRGFSVDLVNEIAKKATPPFKVEWHKLSWDSLKADMSSGRFDFVAEPVYQTVPRAEDFGLCTPYAYVGIAVAVVRKDDNRFRSFQDLNQSGVTIAVAQGWTSTEYAQKTLTRPTFKAIAVTGDAVTQMDEVALGRADVALNDVPTVAQYVKAHSDKVKALWLSNPPSSVAGAFITRKEDVHLRDFLNAATSVAIVDGTVAQLDKKWKGYAAIPVPATRPGGGLAGL